MKFYNMKDFANELEKKRPDVLEELTRDEPNYIIIHQIIKKRIEKGLTQAELAKKANLTQTQISRIESAQLGNINTLLKVLDVLGLQLAIKDKISPTS